MQKAYFSLILSLFVTLGSFGQTNKVGPLLRDINWHQTAPYNDLCPILKPSGKRALVGCGATSSGQIMKFHKHPTSGTGTVKNSGDIFILSNFTYNWNLMLPTYASATSGTSEQRKAVAEVLRHIGAAMGMEYNATGSGSSLNVQRDALITNFGYKATTNIIYRIAYTEDEWFEVIKREIDAGRPVAYSGNGKEGGHLFVCDGYDTSNKTLHFNYGWNGYRNNWVKAEDNAFNERNEALIGLHPTTSDIDPTVAMYTPLNFSDYTPTLGKNFDVAVNVANLGKLKFENELGVALYKGTTLVKVLQTVRKSLNPTYPTASGDTKPTTYNLLFQGVSIPAGTAAGTDYQLRLVVKKSTTNTWCPALGLTRDVVRVANLEISADKVASITYPLGSKQLNMELTQPLEISVANNRAVANFTVKNTNPEYDFKGDIFVVVSPNNEMIPSVWKTIKAEIPTGLTESFSLTDIALPAGVNVDSCRFSVAYSRMLMEFNGADISANREMACVPMMPAKHNLRKYRIPKEETLFSINFARVGGVMIPTDYKMYYPDGTPDLDGKTWGPGFPNGNAYPLIPHSKLVTSAIDVKDENAVLEWKLVNPYVPYNLYRVYISTEGQAYEHFKELKPAYEDSLSSANVARVSLSEYAAKKKVYIMFESVGQFPPSEVNYFKILNITSPKDISLQEVNIPGSSLAGESFPVKVSVKNHSAVNVKKVKATYTIEGLPPVTEEIATDIPFNVTKELTFSKPVVLNGEPGKQRKIDVRVEQAGEEAEYKSNNDGSTTHILVDFYPKKNIVLFKSSKLKCGPCGKTYSVIDEVDKMLPEAASGVEVWKDGIFAHPDFIPYATGETPTFFANGRVLSGHATWNVPGELNKVYKKMTPPAEVFVQADYENENSRKLKIKITCRFAAPLKGNYRLGAYIIENNIINTIGEIAGSHPEGEKLTKNHMPVGTIGGSKGSAAGGYLISDPEAKTYVFDCEYTIPSETASRYRKDNVQVIGLLFSSTGEILNSALNSHYIFLPETKGLTFIDLEGGSPFKRIYEVGFVHDTKYISLVNYRSTILTGGRFRFKVAKDASWDGKILRMRVNPDADYNKGVEQFLLPDENGVYTIDKMNMNYYMRVDTADTSKPLVDKKGAQLVLSGTWTSADFATMLDLSSPSLTGVDMTGINIPSGDIKLNPANPNLLIYTATGASVPTSWKNVVKGTKADRIVLKDGYSFYNSKEFTAATIIYTRNYSSSDWVSGCLPFAVSTLPADLTAEHFSNSQDTTVHFEGVKALEANTPYIFKATGVGEKIFAATNTAVPVTDPVEVVKVNYSFNGTFDKMEGVNVNGLYLLNPSGTSFEKANTTDTISTYRAFIKYNGTKGVPTLTIIHDDVKKPNLSQNDSELVMSGTWKPDDFNTKLDLSSDSITGVDMTGIEIPKNAPALNVTNPNLLIYTAEDAEVPASWTNVVKGTKADSIALKDGSPFYSSKEFTASVITYTRTNLSPITRGYTSVGRETICLPFEVSTLPADVMAEGFSNSKDSTVSFEAVSSLYANTPYLLSIMKTGEKVFTATNAVVAVSAPVEVTQGDYSFNGTFSKMDVNGLYKLRADGSGFEKVSSSDSIPAYHAFLKYNGTHGADFLTIAEKNDNKPISTPKGSQLILSGTWTLADFAKLDLSSDTITGVDMTDILIPGGDIKLKAANPNLLIYTAEDASVPTSWTNVVKGTKAGNIVLKDGYSFYNSKAFTASSITYMRDYTTQGWESGCLPFAVSTLPANIVAKRFSHSQDAMVSFEGVSSLEANTPYIFHVTGTGKKVFSATYAEVPVTSLVIVTKGDYSFNGTFNKMNVNGLYKLKADGSGFEKVSSSNSIPAYRAFIRNNGTHGADFLTIAEKNDNKPISTPMGSQLILSGTWTLADFTKLDLSSDTITGVDMTGVKIPTGDIKLNAANPNLLIYTAEDANVPTSWTNVVKGTKAGSIVLKDGYSFYNSKAFTASSITYTRDYTTQGWESGCLPFAVSTLPAHIVAKRFSYSQGTQVRFEEINSLEANTPYIFHVTGTGKKVFTATHAEVPVTSLVIVTRGDYSFNGTFNKMDVNGLYKLEADGSGFEKVSSSNSIPAYRAFIRCNGIHGADFLTITEKDDNDNKPVSTPMGSQLILSGTWTLSDFAKLDLSSDTITGVDMTNILIPGGDIKLNAANPNLLIYTAEDANVPTSWTNVVKGTMAGSIVLKDGYSFYNSKAFTASSITYTRDYTTQGWESGCLPFAVSTLPAYIVAKRFSHSQDTMVSFEGVSSLEANTPYIFLITGTGKKEFSATQVEVPVTSLVIVTQGDYSLNGTFTKMEGADVVDLYLLNPAGTHFLKTDVAGDISAYRAFIRCNEANGASSLTIKQDDISKPIKNTSGSELILSGTWTLADLATLSPLAASITGIDMTKIQIPAGAPALTVGNPNMLIYTSADANVPASWTNVVKGTEAQSIVLKDGFSFYNTKVFTASSITYTRDYAVPGWTTGCLPFALSTLPTNVTAEGFVDSRGAIVIFEKVSFLEANTPYLFNIKGVGKNTFTATNTTVPTTVPVKVVRGNYSFNGTFNKMEGEKVTGLYLLNPGGGGFQKANSTHDIPAYRGFIQYNGINGASSLMLKHDNGVATGSENIAGDRLVIRSINGTLEITAPRCQQVNIYSLNGRLARALMLNEGVNTVYGLAKGFYIVNNQKIIIR